MRPFGGEGHVAPRGVSTFVPLFQGGRRASCGRGSSLVRSTPPVVPLAKGDKPLSFGQSIPSSSGEERIFRGRCSYETRSVRTRVSRLWAEALVQARRSQVCLKWLWPHGAVGAYVRQSLR